MVLYEVHFLKLHFVLGFLIDFDAAQWLCIGNTDGAVREYRICRNIDRMHQLL